jgi:divalent metal cation (Fe/Co/Zn/Cd) transporter
VPHAAVFDRPSLARRSRWLTTATLAYNSLEAVIAIVAGVVAGSVALVGFGFDSAIELSAGVAALWRLAADADVMRREQVERRTLRFIGLSFLALAVYISYDAIDSLITGAKPQESTVGIVIAAASLIVMPLLARSKRRLALALQSGALVAEAKQTQICAYLSAILLAGLALNATVGWWWADPVAALAMVPLIIREGVLGVRGQSVCCAECVPTGTVTSAVPLIQKL